MSDHVLSQTKHPKLIVVIAFDRGADGELFPAFGPEDQQSEDRAIRTARALAGKHVGVIAWSREANPDIGKYGPPTQLRARMSAADASSPNYFDDRIAPPNTPIGRPAI